MVIKYHTYKLLNDILPKSMKDSDTQLQWLKSLINPLNQKQDELNTQQDLIVRDMKHNGQEGVIDHMINHLQYPDIAGLVYFQDVDFDEETILITDSEETADIIYLYTDSETGDTGYTETYFITDGEGGYEYNSFNLIIPEMYEDTDIENGVEYYVNKYKPAGKTYDILYYSGVTTADQITGYTMFQSWDYDNLDYTSLLTGFTISDTGLTTTLVSNHNMTTTWDSDSFFFSSEFPGRIVGTTGYEPDTGVVETGRFTIATGLSYRIKYIVNFYDQFGVLKPTDFNGADIEIRTDIGDTYVWGGNITTSGTYEEDWVATSNGSVYIRMSYTNEDDYDYVDFQYNIEEVGTEYSLIYKQGYVVGFDIDSIETGTTSQYINIELVDISGNSISNISKDFNNVGTGNEANLSPTSTTNGRIRFNIYNPNNEENTLKIDTITFDKKDYSN